MSASAQAETRPRLAQSIAPYLALLPTPLLLFVSSSSAIYLRNQRLLQHQYGVLTPFFKLFLLTLVVGALLAACSSRWPRLRFPLAIYYLTGPLFLVFGFLRALRSDVPVLDFFYATLPGLTFWLALLLVLAVALRRRLFRTSVIQIYAAFGLILFAYEGGHLAYNIWRVHQATDRSIDATKLPPHGDPSLPNIYHLVFDAYQTDLLEHTLSDEAKKSLGGFVYFPNNESVWGLTEMSMASVFSGRRYAYDRPQTTFVREAFNSEVSLFYWLELQKYQTMAFVSNSWIDYRDDYLDSIVTHEITATEELLPLNTESFRNLWLYGMTPVPLREPLKRSRWFSGLDSEDFDKLEEGLLLPASAPVVSYLGFRRMMALEESLPSAGRYTIVHVIIPHEPFQLRSDCSYRLGASRSHVLDQSRCALRLIQDFVDLLEELGRFEDSLILIHGDHGGFHRTRNGELVEERRSRSLDTVLLVKPVGVARDGELQQVEVETTLLDVPMIIMNSVQKASIPTRLEPWRAARSFVPRVEGEQLDSAEILLRHYGFELGELRSVVSDRVPQGTVLSQNPPAYTPGGDTLEVALDVASAPPQGPDVMPDLVGRDVAQATSWLRDQGLAPSSIRDVPHAFAPKGMVVAQSPRPHQKIEETTEVVVYVSKGN